MATPRPPNDGLSDSDLLVLCALADEIHVRSQWRSLTAAEGKFLRLMRQRELWVPKD